jgi:CRISPR-associated protein Cmr1
MNKFTVELETITHMFSYGSDKYKPEFRVTELKSLMRNTFREFYDFKNLKEMKEKEAELFGDLNKASPVKIILKKTDIEPFEEYLLPHKITEKEKSLMKCIKDRRKFNIIFVSNHYEKLICYLIILIQSSILGAFLK